MENCNSTRRPFAALAVAAALSCGPGAASAATVPATLDFGTEFASVPSPYIEDGFEVSGINLGLANTGNPTASILLDRDTASLTLTRVGGGAFSLLSFDYACNPGLCDFMVGSTAITSGSSNFDDFATVAPAGFESITSLVFTRISSDHYIDNIVLEFDDASVLPPAPIPLPAAFPLLLGAVAGLGFLARRKGRAACRRPGRRRAAPGRAPCGTFWPDPTESRALTARGSGRFPLCNGMAASFRLTGSGVRLTFLLPACRVVDLGVRIGTARSIRRIGR